MRTLLLIIAVAISFYGCDEDYSLLNQTYNQQNYQRDLSRMLQGEEVANGDIALLNAYIKKMQWESKSTLKNKSYQQLLDEAKTQNEALKPTLLGLSEHSANNENDETSADNGYGILDKTYSATTFEADMKQLLESDEVSSNADVAVLQTYIVSLQMRDKAMLRGKTYRELFEESSAQGAFSNLFGVIQDLQTPPIMRKKYDSNSFERDIEKMNLTPGARQWLMEHVDSLRINAPETLLDKSYQDLVHESVEQEIRNVRSSSPWGL